MHFKNHTSGPTTPDTDGETGQEKKSEFLKFTHYLLTGENPSLLARHTWGFVFEPKWDFTILPSLSLLYPTLPQTLLGFMTINNIPLHINSKPERNKDTRKQGTL